MSKNNHHFKSHNNNNHYSHSKSSHNNTNDNQKNTSSKRPHCTYCGEDGHWYNNCFKKQNGKKANDTK